MRNSYIASSLINLDAIRMNGTLAADELDTSFKYTLASKSTSGIAY
jgi:hypothetical protein